MQDKLTKLWKICETKQLSKIFEEYMKNTGVRKYLRSRKDNSDTYLIDGKSTDWNRVQCYYRKGNTKFGQENILLVLRKRAGNYFIIERQSVRAFEVDYKGVIHYDEKLLNEIMEEHKPLFDVLLGLVT